MTTAAEYREMAKKIGAPRIHADPNGFAHVDAAFLESVAAALREAAEMVRDHEAMEKLRADRVGSLLWTYNLDLWQVEPHERGTYADPVDAILGGEPHEEM